MNINLKSILFVSGLLGILSSCGGSGSVSSSKLFGDLPGIVLSEKQEKEAVNAKLGALSSDDKRGFESIMNEAKEKEAKYENAKKEAGAKLAGTELPVEIESGVPCKISSPICIKEVTDKGKVILSGEIEITEDITFNSSDNLGGSNFSFVFVDENGVGLQEYHPGHIRKEINAPTETVKAGSKHAVDCNFKIGDSNAESLLKAVKIVVADKRKQSKAYVEARDAWKNKKK